MIRYTSGSKYRRHARTSRPWTAVQDECRLSIGVTARLPVDEVGVANVEQSVVEGLDSG